MIYLPAAMGSVRRPPGRPRSEEAELGCQGLHRPDGFHYPIHIETYTNDISVIYLAIRENLVPYHHSAVIESCHFFTAGHSQIDPVIRGELDLVRVALEGRFESQDRKMLMLDQALHREREAANCDAEKLSAMEADVSSLRWLLGETVASVQTAARNIDLMTAAAAEQQLAYGRNICALEEEMGRARETIAGQGDELVEPQPRKSEPGRLVQQLEGEIQLLRESSEGLKGHLAGVEAEQQTEVARLQEAMTAGELTVRDELGNVQR
jgi:hypothetical protein